MGKTCCDGTGKRTAFAVGIGPYTALCECHKVCESCRGSGEGKPGFAIGIGPYMTTCQACRGKGRVPK